MSKERGKDSPDMECATCRTSDTPREIKKKSLKEKQSTKKKKDPIKINAFWLTISLQHGSSISINPLSSLLFHLIGKCLLQPSMFQDKPWMYI